MEPKISITVQPAPLDVITTPEFEAESKRLIAMHAAAVDMLAALRELTIAAEGAGWDVDQCNSPILNAARAAIAKAEAR